MELARVYSFISLSVISSFAKGGRQMFHTAVLKSLKQHVAFVNHNKNPQIVQERKTARDVHSN